MPDVAIVIGSESDREIADEAVKALLSYGVTCEVKVLSAHRKPKELEEYVRNVDAKVFIAVAGLSAHLPGFIASRTVKPVIGVPVSKALGGLDALLSIVQMPKGVPVAAVGINNGFNAALLAIRILALENHELRRRIQENV
jgi:5-(carboxyamino)imidazole ribonucleotide mutase